MSGLTAWQVWHQVALQSVIRGRLLAALRSVSVCRSFGWRIGSKTRFVLVGVEEGKREKARVCGRRGLSGRRRWRAGRSIVAIVILLRC